VERIPMHLESKTKPPESGELRDPRVYLATERTFLAWIRTGLALMGFGFVVARFGLFMREIEAARGTMGTSHGLSLRFGTSLVILGVALTVAAIYRYVHLLKRLDAGEVLRKPSRLAISLGIGLALAGSVVSIYLVLTP
jgi:putative membrane protein